jgi:hypothetical protein
VPGRYTTDLRRTKPDQAFSVTEQRIGPPLRRPARDAPLLSLSHWRHSICVSLGGLAYAAGLVGSDVGAGEGE